MASSRSRKRNELPFYKIPDGKITSEQIIEDARRSVKAIPTGRPITPASGRTLFTDGTGRRRYSRPPSVYSLGHSSYTDDYHPTTAPILTPIEKILAPTMTIKEVNPVPPTPLQSCSDITSCPSPSASTDTLTKDSTVATDRTIPPLKKSESSPASSRRVKSASGRVSPKIKKTDSIKSQHKNLMQSKSEITLVNNTGDSSQDEAVRATSSDGIPVKPWPSLTWDNGITPLLHSLDGDSDVSVMCDTCDKLSSALQHHQFTGRTAGEAGRKKRSKLLTILFNLLKQKEPRLLVKVARIILMMEVADNNLLNVCKLVFKLSRETHNDPLFIEECIIDLLLSSLLGLTPLDHSDIMIYGIGTIKLLATNTSLSDQLYHANIVEIFTEYLRKCPMDSAENVKIENILIQLIGALRNLSDNSSIYSDFVSHGILPLLLTAVQHYGHNPDVAFNAARFLSKVTLDNRCKMTLAENVPQLSSLINLINIHINNADIIVRLCFILSNLTSSDITLGDSLHAQYDIIPSLDKVIALYLNMLREGRGSAKTLDVLIKAVCVLANLSVTETIATYITGDETTVQLLCQVLAEVSIDVCDELIVNTLAALNNLSYYTHHSSVLFQYQQYIAKALLEYLVSSSGEVLLETIRVLGNLSKYDWMRRTIAANKVDELLVTLLDSKDLALVYAACGVLVNLLVDGRHRHTITNNSGLRKMVDVLAHFGRRDWLLSSLVCKMVWNYSEGFTCTDINITEESQALLHLLEEYLDPVTAFQSYMNDTSTDDSNDGDVYCWKNEFAPVAERIVQKLAHNRS